MLRRLVAGLIVVGLAFGVWFLWPGGDPGPTTTTLAAAPTTTLVVTTPASTSTTSATTTVAVPDIIATVDEAEELLRNLWFGWFEGIYNQDESRIREVVASQSQLDAAIGAFGVMTFDAVPTAGGIVLSEIEVLRADTGCTAIWARLTVDFRPGETAAVEVIRWTSQGWKSVSTWLNRSDLWEQDCEAQLEPLQ